MCYVGSGTSHDSRYSTRTRNSTLRSTVPSTLHLHLQLYTTCIDDDVRSDTDIIILYSTYDTVHSCSTLVSTLSITNTISIRNLMQLCRQGGRRRSGRCMSATSGLVVVPPHLRQPAQPARNHMQGAWLARQAPRAERRRRAREGIDEVVERRFAGTPSPRGSSCSCRPEAVKPLCARERQEPRGH